MYIKSQVTVSGRFRATSAKRHATIFRAVAVAVPVASLTVAARINQN